MLSRPIWSNVLNGFRSRGFSTANAYIDKLTKIDALESQKPISLRGVKYNGSTKRFYEHVGFKSHEKKDGFHLTLGHRLVETPLKNMVYIPTEPLAHAIALEWDSQLKYIKPHSMPLMHLLTISLDHVFLHREKMIASMMNYFHTDSVCLRDDQEDSLMRLQRKFWDPILDYLTVKYGITMNITEQGTSSFGAPPQDEEQKRKMHKLISSLNDYELAALDSLTGISKSLAVSIAILDGQLDLKKGWECARLEENYQMRRYGQVEGAFGHAIDIQYAHMKIAAARSFLNLSGFHRI